jgi:DNA replication protein DnaC
MFSPLSFDEIQFCSQIPVTGCHALIGEGTVANAILDRIAYSSHRIEIEGTSLRKKQKLKMIL